MAFNKNSFVLLALSFLASFWLAYSQAPNNLQPGCLPVPSLPENFSGKPESWPHGTPLLQTLKDSASPPRIVRRASKFWSGWESAHYLFALNTNFTIYGEQPNLANPLGNPSYPGATSAAGPKYIDFLITTYNQSYIQAYNLGYGGATVDPSVVQSGSGKTVQSFQQQVEDEFLSTYVNNSKVPWTPSNSLFSIFFDINDVTNSYAEGNDTINYDLIQAYQNLINELFAARARNFLFLNVPPVDRSPGTLETSASSQAAEAAYIAAVNTRLGWLVSSLAKRHPDTTLFLFDTNWLFTRVLDNPQQSVETAGYLNATEYCPAYAQYGQSGYTNNSSLQTALTNSSGTLSMTYSDPSCGRRLNAYFWLNTPHPTYPMHNFMGSQIAQFMEAVN